MAGALIQVRFAAYDGNGNVMALVNAADGTVSAQYEYGPFGEMVRASGLIAKANPVRLSTKYQDDESDLVYYGYRSYNPNVGRWLNRDPIGETITEPDLYAFVENNSVDNADFLGNATFPLNDIIKNMVNNGKVYNCQIVIYLGHNRTAPPHVPQPRISKCAYASVVTCFGSTIPVERPIPGIEPRPDEYTLLNYAQAAAMADRDYAAGIAAAKPLCGGSCCCSKVLVWINCSGVEVGISPALNRVCNKWTELDCKTGKTISGK